MSEHIVETTTIISENGKTIIIAHPPVKKQINYWQLITGWYQTLKIAFQKVEENSNSTVEVPMAVDYSTPIIIDVQKPIQVIKQQEQAETSKIWAELTNRLSRQNLSLYKKQINQKIVQFDGIDDRLSRDITKFKQQNLIVLGDVRIRSILLGISSALLYKIITSNTKGLVKKTRNLAGSFIFMGYWFVPQLFNPFLRRPYLAKDIV